MSFLDDEHHSPTERLAFYTARSVKLALLTAGLSTLTFAMSSYHRPYAVVSVFYGLCTGVIVGATGFQLMIAHGQYMRIAPERARRWMIPAAYVLYCVAAICVVLGFLPPFR